MQSGKLLNFLCIFFIIIKVSCYSFQNIQIIYSDYISNFLVNSNEKFIVFAHHIVMLDAITQCLEEKSIDYIRIDGSTRQNVRSDLIDYFQNNDECRVAVLSMIACNTGITLTAAKLVIFAELYWNPSVIHYLICYFFLFY